MHARLSARWLAPIVAISLFSAAHGVGAQTPPLAAAPAPASPSVEPAADRRSPTAVVVGAVLVAFGAAGALGGATMIGFGIKGSYAVTPCPPPPADCSIHEVKPGLIAGGGTMAALGLVALGVGIPVLTTGLRRDSGARAALPDVRLGAATATLVWRY